MRGKGLIVFGLGMTGGFIGGSMFALGKIIKSEQMRKSMADILADKIIILLYGEKSHKKAPSNVRYHNFHGQRADQIVFDTKEEAQKIADQMEELVKTYGQLSVADYHDLCGVKSEFVDTKLGWTENTLKNVPIFPVGSGHGYTLDLPATTKI